MQQPILLMGINGSWHEEISGVSRAIRVLEQRYLALSKHVDVRILVPEHDCSAEEEEAGVCKHELFFTLNGPYYEFFAHRYPSSVLSLPFSEKDAEWAVSWPRNIFQSYGDAYLAWPKAMSSAKVLHAALGLEGKIVQSDLGNGGYVVSDGKVMIVSSIADRDQHFTRLMDEGYTILEVPVPSRWSHVSEAERDDKLTARNCTGDIDTELNLVSSPAGNYAIFVQGEYHRRYRDQVAAWGRMLDAVIEVVPEGAPDIIRHAVNFISLPDHHVMVPSGCDHTRERLVRILGRGKVLEGIVDEHCGVTPLGGGLRCMTNLIQ